MIAISLFLVIVSPWFNQLLISPVEWWWLVQPVSSLGEWLRNITFYASPEFIFFSGDRRLAYGTQEFGLMYLSWLPLAMVKPRRYLVWWLGIGILAASWFKPVAPFSAALLYILPLQILVAMGAKYLIANFRRFHPLIKLGIILLALFNVYEIANFWHVLTIHYPQRIHEAVVNQP
ncbi:MAG: hypothetical protein A2784_04570 [Candidatus Chisholmbacteria bacterium RIFCSPHIGHO2_01_FULL_48_12]|uniref:Uncharacterized protein n=1 Tax=Candidatus Chisholmbacteria bacterium RIFCSPHIGHO2_01_FULL_48_12 TaxID=1797589 RepID=A0A1G1VMW4_9BACT|nr:MAG: hypothetical protein A2784_04570 [Candidatus Chisholmbacteria bacterium RIFCSPHIGHO2_01_FULL_48_12]